FTHIPPAPAIYTLSLHDALPIFCDTLDPEGQGGIGVAVDVYHTWWDPELEEQIRRAGKSRLLAFHVCDWLVPTRDLLNDRGMMGDRKSTRLNSSHVKIS